MVICVVLTPSTPQRQINGKKSDAHNFFIFFSITIYTIFWGFRYKVGADYENYADIYKYYDAGIYSKMIEPGFLYLCEFLNNIGFSYVALFVITSFCNIYLLYLAFKSESSLFQKLAIYFYFTSGVVLFAQNGLRQMLVLNILLVTIFAINSKKKSLNIIKVIACCLIAFLIHRSCILPFSLLLALYLLPKIRFNKALLIIPYILLYITSSRFQFNVDYFLPFLEDIGYADNLQKVSNELNMSLSKVTNFSLGNVFFKLITIIVFWFHEKFTTNKSPIYYCFVFVVLGSFISLLVSGMFINRALFYFTSLMFIVLAYLCSELYKSFKEHKDPNTSCNQNIYILILSAYFILYCYSILNNSNLCVPYTICF